MAAIGTVQGDKRQTTPLSSIEGLTRLAIRRIAESDCPVLIVGEPGVGKRFAAARIHALSGRSDAEFNELCCGNLDAKTLSSCLSTSGTVHLREISDLNLSLQEQLIKTYFRSQQPQSCRLLCSTSRDLLEDVKLCRLKEDFYYLVSAVTFRISPLRCRRSEILTIADELLVQYSKQFDRPKPALCKEIVEFIMEHDWPENLPELQTAIKTFVAIGDHSISLAALKAAAPAARLSANHRPRSLKEAARGASAQIERKLISEVLSFTGGNRKRAANELGISYKALLYKLKQIGADGQLVSNRNGVAS